MEEGMKSTLNHYISRVIEALMVLGMLTLIVLQLVYIWTRGK